MRMGRTCIRTAVWSATRPTGGAKLRAARALEVEIAEDVGAMRHRILL